MVGFYRNFPSTSMGGGIFTVYIDNLPNGVGLPWLRKFFSNFGTVKDAYLPIKRSKRTGNRFGFVKYVSIKGADQAIEKANGFWIGKKHLIVERASFDLVQQPGLMFRNAGLSGNNFYVQKGINQGEVWGGKMKEKKNERMISLNLQPVAVEWLTRSVVAKLKALTTPELVQHALRDFKFNDVVVRSLGGLKLIITFQTRADRAAAMRNSVIVNWFNSFKPWNGEVAGESRLIWLKCRGMPLTVWNAVSFKRLSESWGDFITLDVETLKEESYDVGRMLIATEHPQKIDDWINITVRGKNHRVKIWEEACDDIFNEKPIWDWVNKQHAEMRIFPISDHEVDNDSCKMNNNVGVDVGLSTFVIQYEGEDEVSQVKALEKMKDGGTITLVQKSSNEVDMNGAKEKVDDLANHLTNDSFDEKEKVDDLANHALAGMVVDQINENTDVINENNVVAAMDSMSSSLERESSAVGSEKVLDSVMVTDEAKTQELGEESDKEAILDPIEDNHVPIQTAVKGLQGKKRRKTINEILGFSKVNTGNSKGRRSKNKCVVLRSAIAAAALSASISSDGINNRNKILLDEARTIWEINKMHGIGYDGDEEEVISKIAEMEAQNKERVDGQL